MDAQLQKKLDEMHRDLLVRDLPRTKARPIRSDTLANANQKSNAFGKGCAAGRWRINFTEILRQVPTLARIHCNQNATVRFWMLYDNQDYVWEEGMVANSTLVLEDDNWVGVEIVPAAYPATIKGYLATEISGEKVVKLGGKRGD